jgi:hypothetical protein
MPGQRPSFRFPINDEGSEEPHEIGAAWSTMKADVFSVALDLESTGERTVKADSPRQQSQSARGDQPAA